MTKPDVSRFCAPSDDMNDLSDLKQEELSQEECAALECVVWRKLDRRILPLCACFFLLLAVCTTNIGNARIAGLQTSLALSDYQFSVALTVFPYVISQFLPTLLLKYVGPDLILPSMIALGGVVSASQGLITNYSGLLACRFFLGLTQGAIPACIILYLSFFYPRKRLQIRVATFFTSASLAGAFSGFLAAAIDQLNGRGGKSGWAWIFILEGLFSFMLGVISFFLLPRSPETVRFLTEKERAYVISTLKHTGSVSEEDDQDSFSWTEVIGAAKSPHVWLATMIFFFSAAILLGLAFFEPTIVASLGYTGNKAQLMSVPPFVTTFVLSFLSAIFSDRYQRRGYTVIFFSLLQATGFIVFYVSTSNHTRYASLFFSVTGAFCTVPALNTWLANNSTPHARRATAVAVTSIVGELGGILAIWLLGSLSPGPEYTSATITFIAMSFCMVVISVANLVYLQRENKLKAEKRQRMTKEEESKGLGDRSAWFIYSL